MKGFIDLHSEEGLGEGRTNLLGFPIFDSLFELERFTISQMVAQGTSEEDAMKKMRENGDFTPVFIDYQPENGGVWRGIWMQVSRHVHLREWRARELSDLIEEINEQVSYIDQE